MKKYIVYFTLNLIFINAFGQRYEVIRNGSYGNITTYTIRKLPSTETLEIKGGKYHFSSSFYGKHQYQLDLYEKTLGRKDSVLYEITMQDSLMENMNCQEYDCLVKKIAQYIKSDVEIMKNINSKISLTRKEEKKIITHFRNNQINIRKSDAQRGLNEIIFEKYGGWKEIYYIWNRDNDD